MQLLHGRYEIVEIIKSGGMGSVYEARDTKLADSPCAVKEILEDKQNVLYFQTRFEQEMKVLAELDHPAIPRVRDFFRLKGKHYLVMDLVRGQSLFDELEAKGQPSSPEQVAKDMLELLDVLDYLHSHHPPMIHRDIKPSNILRDRRSGQIKLVDFGLARTACGATQTAVGTLGYCAPEQSVGRAEPRSDLYSVGATMLGLLSGQDPDLLNPNNQLQSIPIGLRQVVQRATRLKAQERYSSAKEMATDLRLWQSGLGAAAGRVVVPAESSAPEVVYVHSQASPWRGYLTAAAVVLALGLGTWLGRAEAPAPSEPNRPPVRTVVEEGVAEPRTVSAPVASMPSLPPASAPLAAPQPILEERLPASPPAPPAPVAVQAPPRPPVEIHPSLGRASYPTYQPSQSANLSSPATYPQARSRPEMEAASEPSMAEQVSSYPTAAPEPAPPIRQNPDFRPPFPGRGRLRPFLKR